MIFNFLSTKEMAERIVEESPKLKALKEVLEEIAVGSGDTVNVLILANDDRTVTHIQHVRVCLYV